MSDENRSRKPHGSEAPEASTEPDELSLPSGMELDELMRRAFKDDFETESSIDVLRGVQDKLSERSGGKFYGDGWGRTRHAPFATFFITSLMMLSVLAVIYAVLVPLVGDPITLPLEPKPVQILQRK